MSDWVLDWSAWEAQEARLAAARAALQAEALDAARLRARVAVVAVLHGARPETQTEDGHAPAPDPAE